MVAAQSLAPSKSSPWQDEQFMEKFNALPEHRQRRAIVSSRLNFLKIPLNHQWTTECSYMVNNVFQVTLGALAAMGAKALASALIGAAAEKTAEHVMG